MLEKPGDRDDIPPAALADRAHQRELSLAKRREIIQAYYASITLMDACVGKLLDALDRLKLADNTIVVFFSDHGYHLGQHGLWQKSDLFEGSARVPLILSVPGMKNEGQASDSLAELIDLYPTLAEYCGLPPKEGLDGRSFAPVLHKPDTRWNTPTLTTMGFKNHSLRGPRYRYTRYADGSEELYDHQNDPMEWRNLTTDQGMEAVKARFRSLLPQHDEPETPKNDIDNKRMRRTLSKIKGMSRELKDQAEANTLDSDFVKKIYSETK